MSLSPTTDLSPSNVFAAVSPSEIRNARFLVQGPNNDLTNNQSNGQQRSSVSLEQVHGPNNHSTESDSQRHGLEHPEEPEDEMEQSVDDDALAAFPV
jgi:hypothetical protein